MNQAPSGSLTPVDTAKIADRRVLRFDSLDQMLAEVDRHLIPSASSEQMRHRLQELRAMIVAHLGHAEYVQGLITEPVSADPP